MTRIRCVRIAFSVVRRVRSASAADHRFPCWNAKRAKRMLGYSARRRHDDLARTARIPERRVTADSTWRTKSSRPRKRYDGGASAEKKGCKSHAFVRRIMYGTYGKGVSRAVHTDLMVLSLRRGRASDYGTVDFDLSLRPSRAERGFPTRRE